ncbi:P-loop containing nucleoside triphosphate hydrolase protein [Terfezia boudieri ATCC MYA-4762]|uniref:P-loop containing nucleoside triphosphate hydrolase protein n=1 Tax=Terfezia boudieri ATCC MYA-4762 TaxID=1051890 RepID=A0A3N4LM63_9PEZI|nr:P-loop containing nucleoside triphosphate hydrolase protein [Terfezia boudieri ATCC MYA-4762]
MYNEIPIDEEEASDLLENSYIDSGISDDEGSARAQSKPVAKFSFLFSFFPNSRAFYYLLTACLATVISGFIVPAMSVVIGKILDSLLKFGLGIYEKKVLRAEVQGLIWHLLGLGIGAFISNGVLNVMWQRCADLQAKRARECVFESLVVRELEWFDKRKHGVGAMLTQTQTQIWELETALGQPLGLTLQSVIISILSLVVSLLHCWRLTLAILVVLPITGSIQYYLHSKLPPLLEKQKQHLAEASKSANRTITNIANVKSLNGQAFELGVFSEAVEFAGNAFRLQAHYEALKQGIFQSVILAMFASGFWYYRGTSPMGENGKDQNSRGATQPGDIITSTWSCLMAAQHFLMMVPQLAILEKGKIAGAHLSYLMSRTQRVLGRPRGLRLKEFGGGIKFHDVSFAYPSRPSQRVLKNITLSIAPNKATWIVGKSGSGKSTIGNLILKSYNVQGGFITLDGKPLESLDTDWMRENITVVQQHSVLFNDTVFRNIALGKAESRVSIQQAKEALLMAGGEGLIYSSDDIWSRMAGARGLKLSGGQKQRVVLARAILRDTPFLILDEAVSAMDSVTRSKIIESIIEWRKDRTTVIITHDISQIPFGDMVYFIEDGVVAESGLRLELEDKGDGYFQKFVQTFKASMRTCESTPEDYRSDDYEYGFSRGKPIIGFSSGVETGSSERPNPGAHGQYPHRRKIPAWPPEIPNHQFDSPDYTTGIISTNSKESSLIPPQCESIFAIWPLCLLFKKQKSDQLDLYQIFLTVWSSLTQKYRLVLILGIIATFVHAIATPVFSFALSRLLASFVSPDTQAHEFKFWEFVASSTAIVDGVAYYTMLYCLAIVSQEWVDYHRNAAYRHILKQPLEWFEDPNNEGGGISQDLEKHAEQMKEFVSRFTGNGLVGVVMLVVAAIWCLILCWRFTLLVAVILAALSPLEHLFQRAADSCEEKYNSAVVESGNVLQEAIENVSTVKMLQLDGYFRVKYQKAVNRAFKTGLKRCLWGGCAFGMAESFMPWALALILSLGTYLVAEGLYGLEPILGVLTILSLTLAQITSILGMIPQLSSCKDAARRVLRLSQLQLVSHESLGSLRPISIQGTIVFNNLSFSYRNSIPVLDEFDLSIPSHKPPLLITGSSGCGKSSLFKLLLRLYHSPSGAITLDGIPICDIDVKYLREVVAIVPASPGLFDGLSVFENIAYGSGSRGCSPEAVYNAAKLAGIHDFIVSLSEGYHTILNRGGDGSGSGGCSLSGGQAQRVAIARAVARKPKVLLLDEPCSALDVESEKVLDEGLRRLTVEEGMTVVVITHGNVGGMGCGAEGHIGRRVVVSGGKIVE